MITALQAITSQYFPTQLWSVQLVDSQQACVCEHSLELLGQRLVTSKPGIIWCNLEAETIGIDKVRQLQGELRFSSGSKRFVFILFADQLTLQAQHAILKLLEEPPANTQLVLVSNKPHALLATIRSRCSEQRVGSAASTVSSELAELYKNWKQLSISDAISTAESYKKREVVVPLLESLVSYLRNEVLPNNSESKQQLQGVLADIDNCLHALEQLSHNTNAQLTMENLFFHLNKHTT